MRKAQSQGSSELANPIQLGPFDRDNPKLAVVIIETPKGSRNKYAYDPKERLFELRKVLPAGMAFPHDFGFVPSTKGGDGDPLDALVLMDEPAFAGCKVACRVVGVIETEQRGNKTTERNDFIVAIAAKAHAFAQVRRLEDLGRQFVGDLEQFFVSYHELSGIKYRILARKGPEAARRAIARAQTRPEG